AVLGEHYALLCLQTKAKSFLAQATLLELRRRRPPSAFSVAGSSAGSWSRPQSALPNRAGFRPSSAFSGGSGAASSLLPRRRRPVSASSPEPDVDEEVIVGTPRSLGSSAISWPSVPGGGSRPGIASILGALASPVVTARPRWSGYIRPSNVPPLALEKVEFGEPYFLGQELLDEQ
ncbi:unnamed protein product, partial [Polarella glacialis]